MSTEDKLDLLKKEYDSVIISAKARLKNSPSKEDANSIKKEIHSKGVEFFNLFGTSIDIYDSNDPLISEDYKNKKYEDALNFCDTIIKHWQVIRKIEQKFDLTKTTPSKAAYGGIQRLINKKGPRNKTSELMESFKKQNLPIEGFGKKHSNWETMKEKYLKLQLWIGLPMLIVCGILAFLVPDLTGTQYLFVRALLALSISVVGATVLEGNIDLKWSMEKALTIRAVGWIAVFILLYFLNPPNPPNI